MSRKIFGLYKYEDDSVQDYGTTARHYVDELEKIINESMDDYEIHTQLEQP